MIVNSKAVVSATLTGNLPGGDRAEFFLRVIAVGFDIGNVVEQIHGARDQAKQKEPRHRSQKRFKHKQLLVKDQTKKDEAVLRPLTRAHGFDEGFEHEIILLCSHGI